MSPPLKYLAVTLLALFPVLIAVYAFRRSRVMNAYPSLSVYAQSSTVEYLRWFALALAVLSVFLTLLDHKYEKRRKVPIVEGLEIAVLVDCSKSMLAPVGGGDFTPRLHVTTRAVKDVIVELKQDRWGIGCFSSKLNGVSPLSNDFERLLNPKLEVMEDPRYIELVGKGTNFGAAIDGCKKIFNAKKSNKKVCIILSDGEPQGNEAALQTDLQRSVGEMKSFIAEKNLEVAFYLVGVGSPDQPYKIPVYDGFGNPKGFAEDKDGNMLMSRPDPEYLKRIADQFGGEYIHLENGERLARLLEDITNAERRIVGEKEEVAEIDLSTPYTVLIIVCLFVFLVAPKWNDLRKQRKK